MSSGLWTRWGPRFLHPDEVLSYWSPKQPMLFHVKQGDNMAQERKLGRGLGSLLATPRRDDPDSPPAIARPADVLDLPVDAIYPNRLQPRKTFELDKIEDIAASMKEVGLLTPILVTPDRDGRYELIAGERRWRAACQLGWETIRAQVRQADEQDRLVLALVENIQREDLNPIERALAYRELVSSFGLTHEEAARRVGKNRSTLTNLLRLLDLPEDLRERIRNGQLSEGHGRSLLGIESDTERRALADQIVEGGLSVRAVESAVANRRPRSGKASAKKDQASAQVQAMEQRIARVLGTKVRIGSRGQGGRIVIEYFSSDDFQRILGLIEKR